MDRRNENGLQPAWLQAIFIAELVVPPGGLEPPPPAPEAGALSTELGGLALWVRSRLYGIALSSPRAGLEGLADVEDPLDNGDVGGEGESPQDGLE